MTGIPAKLHRNLLVQMPLTSPDALTVAYLEKKKSQSAAARVARKGMFDAHYFFLSNVWG